MPIDDQISRLECAYLSSTTVTDQDELESGGLSHDVNGLEKKLEEKEVSRFRAVGMGAGC